MQAVEIYQVGNLEVTKVKPENDGFQDQNIMTILLQNLFQNTTVDGSEIRRGKPVDMGKYPIIYRVSYMSGGDRWNSFITAFQGWQSCRNWKHGKSNLVPRRRVFLMRKLPRKSQMSWRWL